MCNYGKKETERGLDSEAPKTEAVLFCCTAAAIFWMRWWWERGSEVTSEGRRPSSRMKDFTSGPKAPNDSTATGTQTEVAGFQMATLRLLLLYLFSHCAGFPCGEGGVGGCKGVRAGGIPHKSFPPFPRDKKGPIWPLAVWAKQTHGLQIAGYPCTPEGPLCDVI